MMKAAVVAKWWSTNDRRIGYSIFIKGVLKMPEVILCKRCKQSINKETDQYVVLEKGTDRDPEALAHVACEQKRPAVFGFDDWVRRFWTTNRP
jgi:hypothetical protein